jgi:RimJ/RimL family protein N-acetyltransferase
VTAPRNGLAGAADRLAAISPIQLAHPNPGTGMSTSVRPVADATIGGMPAPPPTARLAFREMTPHDLDDMAALLSDPDVLRYHPHPKSREEVSAWIAWNRRLYHEHGFGLWLLTLRDTGEFVGDCGLTPQQLDGSTEIEVGYHGRTAFQGRGLATEAASACRDFARDVLKVEA